MLLADSTVTTPTPFGFAGGWGYQQDSTGLQLLGHRYYDPSTGRFLTRDPIKDGRNWYGYCENGPTAYADPNGLDVSVIFDRAAGTLKVTDNQYPSRTVTISGVWSGNRYWNDPTNSDKVGEGPIPGGTYILDTVSYDAHMGYRYKIYVPDGKGGYTYQNGVIPAKGGKTIKRGAFNLHAGTVSDGCITCPSDIQKGSPGYPNSRSYQRVRDIIDRTKPTRFKYTDKKRNKKKIPGQFAGTITVK